MHVLLCGPCSPALLGDLLDPGDAVAASAYPGSGGQPVADLARGLRQAGHTVSVVTMAGRPGAPGALFQGAGVSIRTVPSRHSRKSTVDGYREERAAMASAIRDANPDIVHAHWTYEYELAAQASGILHVTTAHDCPVTVLTHFRDPYRVRRLALALRARPGIRHLSAVSPHTSKRWSLLMGYRRHIEVIPNALPADIGPVVRRPSVTPTILEIADGTRHKNVKGLLWAFQLVRSREPRAQLRLAGPDLGPADRLHTWAVEHGLARGVVFLGRLDRAGVIEELSQAWLLAHASREEGCPMALLEALGTGVPVVGGVRSGGVPYVLDGGRTGRLTDVDAPGLFAETILESLHAGPWSSVAADPAGRFALDSVTTRYTEWCERVMSGAVR